MLADNVGPQFSIVIPCCDEGEMLQRTIASISRSTGPAFEVIVVDDKSIDLIEPSSVNSARVLTGTGRRPAVARNLGASMARGEFLVFVDAHVLVPPEWLSGFLAIFRQYHDVATISPGIASEANLRKV